MLLSVVLHLQLGCFGMSFSNQWTAGCIPYTDNHRFGWTGFTGSVHWMSPTASGIFTGFGIYCIFLQCFNYLIDSYLQL